ncbi:NAD+ synthase [Rickettsiella endosymbiont of Dermanyssus gallinae]|uniref:NAD+ synthase n=1 Tax=Rickettsiella endosymbiont of Dermanyssus gallinae TaxID=2856608 RepID=UPI001C52D881|nr:NAD+ synthase [Rickettsiella endosymbiont of Dermanyssus gallinae]
MLHIAVGQFDFLVGGIEANTQKILDVMKEAKQANVDLLVFPELALCGYPPEGLLLREDFKQQIKNALKIIQAQTNDISILLGHPDYTELGIYNAASLIADKKIVATYHKQCLPNYGVFDERRYFKPGNSPGLIKVKNISIGILICEDLWHPGPILSAKHAGAELIICINASPFDETKAQERIRALKINIAETNLPVLYVHGVSGQDDLVFDGGSLAFDSQGTLTAHADFFTEKLWLVDFKQAEHTFTPQALPADRSIEAFIYQALVLAVRDYVVKNHFPGVLLGLSGGIDSALVLAIAVDALGKDRVHAVTLPSRFTSELSLQLASSLAQTLAVRLTTLSIEASFSAFLTTLNLDPQHPPAGITTENIQARCRAVLLMALSNQSGDLLLNASNKSELAVGYSTLYGDMAGGFAVIKDVPKTMIYKLAHYRNTITPIFPKELLSRAPSAELAADQCDEDSLPPYSELDPILALYVEQDKSLTDIVAAGFKKEVVERIIKLVDKSEYKRRQIAVGPRTTTRAFGRERRYPITSGFNTTQ